MAGEKTGDGAAETTSSLARFEENLARIEELTERLLSAMAARRDVRPELQGPSQDLYMKAGAAYMAEMMQNPAKMIEHQVEYWGKTLRHYVEAQQAFVEGGFAAPEDDSVEDKRFSNPLWTTNPYFNFVKQQYLMNAEAVERAVSTLDDLDEHERKRIEYFSRQIIDLFSPTNFLGTNPDALEKAIETDGESLVKGLENLIEDLESHDGNLVVTLADKDAFRVGENLATAPGEVVYRNHMFELIQYAPTTDQVHETPLIIFPPWINKFYILDLKPQNSFIRWAVDQGYTLFIVSWVNPDAGYRDVGMTDYVEDGFLKAIATVKEICGTRQVNAIGYCIAGTSLSLTLALMARRGDDSIKSATFFTTLTDFSDPGEVGVFLDDDFVDGLEAEVSEAGYLDRFYMARTFTYLRSNDLVYRPAIKSYMMGQAPPAFDLLYWNGDGTNLPGKMSIEYLRGLCQDNAFAEDGFSIAGENVRLDEVTLPVCAIACETDHIAPWKASYRGVRKMGSTDKTFILSESGHIAGIVNPPSKDKYGHWTNDDLTLPSDAWLAGAEKHDGSWWPRWQAWIAPRSGPMIRARTPGSEAFPPLAPAPGTYVSAEPDT